ncbi:MAG: hypothetical protein J6C23_03755 [Clostridia bacterium]|nr:hypothetical protein [Clostridia bacterium]
MKPQIALKINGRLFSERGREYVEELRDEWITAYKEIAKEYGAGQELCSFFTERIKRATELFLSRNEGNLQPTPTTEDCPDGDFPLGNEADMELASTFFSLKELAMLQMGLQENIEGEIPYQKPEYNYARMGFLAELKGLLTEASEYYYEHCGSRYPDDKVLMRCDAIRNKLEMKSNAELLLERVELWTEKDTSIRFLMNEFHAYGFINRVAQTEEEKALVKKCREQILECYKGEFERNYVRIKTYKERGLTDFTYIDSWTLTFDENGNFVKVLIVDIDKEGMPVYPENCEAVYVIDKMSAVKDLRATLQNKVKEYELSALEQDAWFGKSIDLYKLQGAVLTLRQRAPLCSGDNPTIKYDLSGLVGGQLDAAAWQNYAIENGLANTRADYDVLLDRLDKNLQKLIEFYEKALSSI